MTKVTVETVDHVARLAHVSLSEEERTTFARQLGEILAYAESIQGLDTARVEPMSHAQTAGIFREDSPGDGLDRERVVAAAPDAQEGLFRVPRIIAG